MGESDWIFPHRRHGQERNRRYVRAIAEASKTAGVSMRFPGTIYLVKGRVQPLRSSYGRVWQGWEWTICL